MGAKEDQVLRTAKEVIVKFIEIGRISPANFPEHFQQIYEAVDRAAHKSDSTATEAEEES
ncbi:MAG: hypothetical protein ACOCPQ_00855 [Desulfosudaceae bacterium]